jgi:hypothetical protein
MIEAISKWQLANSEPFKDLPQRRQGQNFTTDGADLADDR